MSPNEYAEIVTGIIEVFIKKALVPSMGCKFIDH